MFFMGCVLKSTAVEVVEISTGEVRGFLTAVYSAVSKAEHAKEKAEKEAKESKRALDRLPNFENTLTGYRIGNYGQNGAYKLYFEHTSIVLAQFLRVTESGDSTTPTELRIYKIAQAEVSQLLKLIPEVVECYKGIPVTELKYQANRF